MASGRLRVMRYLRGHTAIMPVIAPMTQRLRNRRLTPIAAGPPWLLSFAVNNRAFTTSVAKSMFAACRTASSTSMGERCQGIGPSGVIVASL